MGHVARMGERSGGYKVQTDKHEGKDSCEKLSGYIIKEVLKKKQNGCACTGLIWLCKAVSGGLL